MTHTPLSRRDFLIRSGQIGLMALMRGLLPAYAWSAGAAAFAQPRGPIDLTIGTLPVRFDGRDGTALAINGTVPGPLVRLKEGEEAVIRVTNTLDEITSIHWHGLIVPPDMDGVPGVSYGGIPPGETFTYRFPVRQSGTYWYHSHSGGQEQVGVYAPLIIDPAGPEPYRYERDYPVVLSDWTFDDPMRLIAKLKSQGDYFNYQQRTLGHLIEDAREEGWAAAIADRLMWARMRMNPTDLLDVTGAEYLYLLNGHTPGSQWTGLFKPGERVRLRLIGAAAMTIFDVRIPGLPMTVVQADGQDVKPVVVDELRISPGETYDVIVEPRAARAYALFAETLDRSGYALGVLAPRPSMRAEAPERRKRAVRSMADMGMADHGMGHGAQAPAADAHAGHGAPVPASSDHSGHGGAAAAAAGVPHGLDHHGPANSMIAHVSKSRLHEPGVGLGEDGRRVLVYTDLAPLKPHPPVGAPVREIELHLTGNMERFMWSINGQKYSEATERILLRRNETVRLTFVNDTMMEHPMHLHGMWMYLENGAHHLPPKHTILVKPAERVSVLVSPEIAGPWAFHCHMLFHMEMGMFRVFGVVEEGAS